MVFSVAPNSAAVCLFRWPLMTCPKTSYSRRVRVESRRLISATSCSVWRMSRSFARAARTACNSPLRSTGFVRTSMAPCFMALTLAKTSSGAAKKMIGSVLPADESVRCNSRPGITSSSSRQPGAAGSRLRKNCRGDENVAARNPVDRRSCATAISNGGSSATTQTVASSF